MQTYEAPTLKQAASTLARTPSFPAPAAPPFAMGMANFLAVLPRRS
ncbi:MAG: hypothetical protein ACLS6O_01655 [Bifidobacterium sp.]